MLVQSVLSIVALSLDIVDPLHFIVELVCSLGDLGSVGSHFVSVLGDRHALGSDQIPQAVQVQSQSLDFVLESLKSDHQVGFGLDAHLISGLVEDLVSDLKVGDLLVERRVVGRAWIVPVQVLDLVVGRARVRGRLVP